MQKVLTLLLVLVLTVFTATNIYAQDEETTVGEDLEQAAENAGEAVEDAATAVEETMEEAAEDVAAAADQAADNVAAAADEAGEEAQGMLQVLKKYFIQGGWDFMSLVLICLILGLAFCIERIITLNVATTNTDKLLDSIDERLKAGDVEGAKEVAKSTAGPTASIMYEGLKNADEGPEAVERAITSYGSVQMGLLEKGLVWISLFIAIAPMLGFMGTVIGMITAFDKIEAAGDIRPDVVAGGIKVALLTTVFGLIVAIILQIFYNYIVSKIDSIVNKMEDASVTLIDIMATNGIFKRQ
ncbi:MAG: MotA/TolQ/ExbB proton channel family protein [Bacteroidota bacterium]